MSGLSLLLLLLLLVVVVTTWWWMIEQVVLVGGRVLPADDNFPCSPDTGKPAFSHCKGRELWVMILEKAWAKVWSRGPSV